MTQTQLAEIVGVGYTTIVGYENGKTLPPIDKLDRIATYFGVSLGNLIDKDLSKPQPAESAKELGEITQTVHKLEQLRGRLIEEYPEVARELGLEVPDPLLSIE